LISAQDAAVLHTFRHVKVEHPTLGQGDALFGAGYRFDKIDFQGVTHILATERRGRLGLPGARSPRAAKHALKDITKPEIIAARLPPPCPALRLIRAPGFARSVNLATVKFTPPVDIAEELVGRRHAFKPLGGGLVVRVHIGVQSLCKLAKCPCNIFLRRIPRHPEKGVGIVRNSLRHSSLRRVWVGFAP
jgi:hypothetical protein